MTTIFFYTKLLINLLTAQKYSSLFNVPNKVLNLKIKWTGTNIMKCLSAMFVRKIDIQSNKREFCSRVIQELVSCLTVTCLRWLTTSARTVLPHKERSRSNFLPCREAFALISKLVSMPLGQGLPMRRSDGQFTNTFHFRGTTSKLITPRLSIHSI